MRTSLLGAAICLVSCSSQNAREQARLMTVIEARVRLPPGAHSLRAYARYYTWLDDGRIFARYTSTRQPLFIAQVQLGQRKWVSNTGQLPKVIGDGCDTVNIVFDPTTARMEPPACNGRGAFSG